MTVHRSHWTRDLTRFVGIAVTLSCLVGAVSACGDDDPVATAPDITTTTAGPSTEPVELSISEAIAKSDAALAAAGSDLCSIMGALRGIGGSPQPTTPEETQQVVEFLGRQYDQIAGALAATDPGNAAKLRNLISSATNEVKSSGYDPATLRSFGTDPDFLAINTIIVGKCPASS